MKPQKNIIALTLAIAFANLLNTSAKADTVLMDWEKAGDSAGWAIPAAEYLKEYPLIKQAAQSTSAAHAGKGALKLSVETAAEGKRQGRVDKYYGGKADWSRFTSFSVMCHVPAGAPDVKGQIAVMSGAWKWSTGPIVSLRIGEWTKVSINTSSIEKPEEIQIVMFIPSIPSGEFKGDLFLDNATLEGEIAIAPSKPGATPTSDSTTWLETFDSAEKWERQGARVEPAPEAVMGSGAATFILPGFITKKIASPKPRNPDALDEGYVGISFWVKGDGSDQFGTLVLCGMHPQWFPFKYACSFPLKDTEWKQYKFGWNDLIPEDATDFIGTPGGAPPSNIAYIKVGSKWSTTFNNQKMPAFRFSLDQLQLETDIPAAAPAPARPALQTVIAKLTAKKPVSILCLGDSITAGTSLGNADKERYAQVLEGLLRERYGYDAITVVSRAVGGAQGNDLRLWVERDFTGIQPDLVTIMFGYNDKTWGYAADYYGGIIKDYVDRIATQTAGKASILLLPPIPGKGPRYLMMDNYADAARRVAKDNSIALCDMHKAFKAFGRDGLNAYMADDAHPNAKGHAVMAKTLADVLAPTR